jgi:glutamyl-Q tRNA(Asp) synthetase
MPTRATTNYIGRFAPSPTGPLHFGSLVAAVASYLQARANNGLWLLRIEDIDPPREQVGAAALIVEALHCYGFEWHGDTIFQSTSQQHHEHALQRLLRLGQVYPCKCSRRDLVNAPRSTLGIVYPGTCRNSCASEDDAALRVRTNDTALSFNDGLQGPVTQRLESESGDFIVRRRDGLIAYHLAVVVDDARQGITEIVRGIDLMDSTLRQIWLQGLLGFPSPHYQHIPVITHSNGDKLSKLTGATGIDLAHPQKTLVDALRALQQAPPQDLAGRTLDQIWLWATENWDIGQLSGRVAVMNER